LPLDSSLIFTTSAQRSLSSTPKSVDHTVDSFALSVILVWVEVRGSLRTGSGYPLQDDYICGRRKAGNHSSILQPHPFPGCLCICSEQPDWLDRRSGISAFAVPEFCNLLPRDLYRNDSQVRCNNARPRLQIILLGGDAGIRHSHSGAGCLARHLSLEGFARWRLRRHTPEPPQPESALTMRVQNRTSRGSYCCAETNFGQQSKQ
jgi:hypothetical protein